MPAPRRRTPEILFAAILAMPQAAFAQDPALPSLAELSLRAGAALGAVLALIAALAFLVRRFKLGAPLRGGGEDLTSIGRLDLGSRREIRLLRVEGRVLVVGVTGERIELLTSYAAQGAADRELDREVEEFPVLHKLANSS